MKPLLLAVLAACGSARSLGPDPDAPGTLVFRGTCDASGAVPLSRTTMLVADDENNILRVYDVERGGAPLAVTDLSAPLGIPLSGKKVPRPREMDLEAGTRIGDRAYWLSSHGRDAKGEARQERVKFFATTVADVALVGEAYDGLLADLIAAESLAPYGLAAAALIAPKRPGGLNLEGMTATPDGQVLLAFRSPVPQGRALVVPLRNPDALISTRGAHAELGEPILLDLGGQGVRSLSFWRGRYLIIAGSPGEGGASRLYTWKGGQAPAVRVDVDLSGFNPEGFFSPDDRDAVLLLSDDGSRLIGGKACKKLHDPARMAFRARWVQPPLP